MFRFTTRDLLWLMVVVGMGVGWWQIIDQQLHGVASCGNLRVASRFGGR